jgi:hypothetical protein
MKLTIFTVALLSLLNCAAQGASDSSASPSIDDAGSTSDITFTTDSGAARNLIILIYKGGVNYWKFATATPTDNSIDADASTIEAIVKTTTANKEIIPTRTLFPSDLNCRFYGMEW